MIGSTFTIYTSLLHIGVILIVIGGLISIINLVVGQCNKMQEFKNDIVSSSNKLFKEISFDPYFYEKIVSS